MTPRLSRSLRPDRVALSVRWLVVMVILFGTIISSIGGVNSHGIAAIAATLHAAPPAAGTEHGHAHDEGDSELTAGTHGASADHPHHGADHSHDKAHALPSLWSVAPPLLPAWFERVRPWIEMVQASRLERPPMG